MIPKKILVVRKMSALEYYYNGNHKSEVIQEGHKNHNQSLQEIEKVLKEYGVEFDIVTRKEISEELVKNYDAVISAGGDGTVIAIAAYNLNVPQLNLKTDSRSIGALCQSNLAESIKLLLNGQYKIEEWQRQDVFLDGNFVSRTLNETCIGENLRFDKLARFELIFSDAETGLIKQESQSGSGLVIVTGTGSSAWPAAFKPFSRNSKFFEFRTLLPHSGAIKNGKANSVKINYKGHEGKFSIDTKEYNLPRDSQIEIKLSKNPLKVIIPD